MDISFQRRKILCLLDLCCTRITGYNLPDLALYTISCFMKMIKVKRLTYQYYKIPIDVVLHHKSIKKYKKKYKNIQSSHKLRKNIKFR